MLFLGRIYIARGPWHLGDFCNIFLPNISEDQKKSYHLSAGPWRCAIRQIRRWLLHYVHIKLKGGLRLQFLGQKPLISPWFTFKFVGKIELRGCAGPSGRQFYLSLITVVRVYCCIR